MKCKGKQIFILLVCVFCVMGIVQKRAIATDIKESGVCGENLTWTLTVGGVLTISGEGAMKDYEYDSKYDETNAPWFEKLKQISNIEVVVEDGVTSIGAYAFSYSNTVKKVTLSDSVTKIGTSAFEFCKNLKVVKLGTGVKDFGERAFAGCYKINDVYAPEIEKWMGMNFETASSTPMQGSGAYDVETNLYFNNVKAPNNIEVPANITEIPKYCFFRFTQMKSIKLHNSITKIGDEAFQECGIVEITLPNSLVDIGEGVFYHNTSLTDITLPDNLITIPWGMFRACTSLKTIHIPESVTTISNAVFSGCTALNEIQLPSHLASIGSGVFSGCTALSEVTLPESIITIESGAFSGCKGLTAINLPDNLEEIQSNAFYKCSKLNTIIIPNKITELAPNVFSGCTALNEITLPQNLKILNNYSLSSTRITKLNLPEGVTTLGDGVFSNCSNLTEISIPNSVSSWGKDIFASCNAINTVYWNGTLNEWLELDFNGYQSNPCYSGAELYINQSLLTDLVIEDGVSEIKSYSFYGCEALETLTIPASITKIGDSAFYNCSMLKTITFLGDVPEISETAFGKVSATCYFPEENETYTEDIKKLDFGGNLIWTYEGEIKDEEFYHCGTDITWELDENGQLILSGHGEMYDYSVDEAVYAPWYEQRESIVAIQIGEGITTIGNAAFYKCSNAESVVMADSVQAIGNQAFFYCNAKNINLSKQLVSIGEYTFQNTKCTNINIPEGVTKIGQGTFQESYLRNISLPDSLTYIPDKMFLGCYYLYTVKFPEKLISIGDTAFSNCYALKSIVLPEGLISIGRYAFSTCGPCVLYAGYYDCDNFTSITLPSTLQSIGENAFYYCQSLGSITIPDNVTCIEKYTFAHCNSLSKAVISENIASISSDAFFYCKNLQTITFKWNAPTINSNTFGSVKATCYYPSNNDAWKKEGMLQNYGGTLTWVAQEMKEPVTNIDITIEVPSNENSNISISEPEEGWVEGSNTFMLKGSASCVVLISNDGGKTYTQLTGTQTENGTVYTATDMTTDTILSVLKLGDINNDGLITNADVIKLRAFILGKIELDTIMQYAADVNGDGNVTNADTIKLRSIILNG